LPPRLLIVILMLIIKRQKYAAAYSFIYGAMPDTRATPTWQRKEIMSSTTDAFQRVIEQAVEAGVRKALNVSEATNRRLFSAEEAAVYLSLSKREVYNMIANRQLAAVTHGRRKMLDIRDLDDWIERNKR
jgi:excisionase family DNA binding protein